MIIHQQFGFARRHEIYYDTETKRGTITLWSSWHGILSGKDPTAYPNSTWSEFIAFQNTGRGSILSINRYTEFQVCDERDLVLIMACMAAGVDGKGFTFTSVEGRKISVSLGREGKWERSILTLNIQYRNDPGKLTIEEASKLAAISKEILGRLGHSKEDIMQDLERMSIDSSA